MLWLDMLAWQSWTSRVQNGVQEFTKRMRTNVTNLRRTLVKYVGWGLLYMGKPFTSVGNWFWKRHRDVLDWNN